MALLWSPLTCRTSRMIDATKKPISNHVELKLGGTTSAITGRLWSDSLVHGSYRGDPRFLKNTRIAYEWFWWIMFQIMPKVLLADFYVHLNYWQKKLSTAKRLGHCWQSGCFRRKRVVVRTPPLSSLSVVMEFTCLSISCNIEKVAGHCPFKKHPKTPATF